MTTRSATPTTNGADLVLRLDFCPRRLVVAADGALLMELHNRGATPLIVAGHGRTDRAEGLSIASLVRARVTDAGGRTLRSSGPILKTLEETKLLAIELPAGGTLPAAPIPLSAFEVEVDGRWIELNAEPRTYRLRLIYELTEDSLPTPHGSKTILSSEVVLCFEP